MRRLGLPGIAGLFLLLGCAEPGGAPGGAVEPEDPDAAFAPEYLPIETQLLDEDLVRFTLAMSGARDADDVRAYADCAAAQYAVIRGFGFARHVSTQLSDAGAGAVGAAALYTISPNLPRGPQTLDAEVTLANCRELGIPTV
ncbi:MAG: hypothetical protein AAF618_04570 [Pseudomonadota bacterium]